MQKISLLSDLPKKLPAEQFNHLLAGKSFRLERILSMGHTTPEVSWYDQEDDEWVLLLAGGAKLEFTPSGEIITLTPGEAVHIPAHCKHRVSWTEPKQCTIWLALHFQADNA